MKRFITTLVYLILGTTFLYTSISSAPAQALSSDQRRIFDLGIGYFDYERSGCAPASNTLGGVSLRGSKVYVLGDSITDGARDYYVEAFTQAGSESVTVNAAGGRNFTGPGTTGDIGTGYDAIQKDADIIRQANVVIMAMGTNQMENFSWNIPEDKYIEQSIESINKALQLVRDTQTGARIFWMDVAIGANAPGGYPSFGHWINKAIYKNMASGGYSVISWSKIVDPSYDPANATGPVSDPNNYLPDGIHPYGEASNALVDNAVRSISSGSVAGGSGGGGSSGGLLGDPAEDTPELNKPIIWSFLVGEMGFSPIHAAALMGNMAHEGLFYTRMVEFGYRNSRGEISKPNDPSSLDESLPPDAGENGQPGYGLVQWSGDRRDALGPFAAENGGTVHSLSIQLKYLKYEIEENPHYKKIFDDVRATTTIREASDIILIRFEVAGSRNEESEQAKRAAAGESLLEELGGISGGSLGAGCASEHSNQGEIRGNIVYYSQTDPRWKDKPYGSSEIGPSGCGPTSVAMVLSTLIDPSLTPDKVAAEFGQYYVSGSGSSFALYPAVYEAYKDRGLQFELIPDTSFDISVIRTVLDKGGFVIASGQGPAPFSDGGHIVVIRGITESGKFLIADPNREEAFDTEYEPSQVFNNSSEMRGFWKEGISV